MQSDNDKESNVPIGYDAAVEGAEIRVRAVVAAVVFDDVPCVVPVGCWQRTGACCCCVRNGGAKRRRAWGDV